MDLHLALLLICFCREVTNGEVTDESVPLVPLMPSQTRENINESTVQPPDADTIQGAPVTATMPNGANGGLSEEEQDKHCMSIGQNPHSRKTIANGIQRLGMQLMQNLAITPEMPNVLISPLSISLALSQLALGAANETKELLMNHLHANTLPCYHESLRNVLAQLRNGDLQIATRIFLRQGFEPKQEFVHESQRLYDSEPVTLEGLQQINEWVEKATNGKMTEFLTSLPPNLLLMLINAVHFKGEWKARFDPHVTSRGVFYIDDKQMVDVEMMAGVEHPLSLFTDDELDAQVARFSFRKSMSLLVVMPMSGQVNVSTLAAKLNISKLYDRLPKERAVRVKVPKFKLEYARELQEVFTKLGLGQIFSQPNLAEMADGPLLVSSVMHKSSMEINEEGAEAAAATAVVILRAAKPTFYLNQPFFLALMDDMTQVPIFMGVVTNPNPGAPILQRGPGSNDKVGFPIDEYVSSFGGPPK
ncbi:LOW QUALITY PROTEIN: alpha-2-antiplasmin-like [Polymixia lowei]